MVSLEVYCFESSYYAKNLQTNTLVCLSNYSEVLKLPGKAQKLSSYYGLLGVLSGCLVFISRAEVVCEVKGSKVYKVTELAELGSQKIGSYLSYIVKHLNFYFSYSMDITTTLQNALKGKGSRKEFQWNSKVSLVPQLELKVICGEIVTKSNLVLISRRHSGRPGPRYFARGLDSSGNSANFVETEVILSCGSKCSSFVILRGSIPLVWTQLPDLSFMPKAKLSRDDKEHLSAFKSHIKYLQTQYGKVTLLNLIRKKGYQKQLGNKLSWASSSEGVPCIWYDYNAKKSSDMSLTRENLLKEVSSVLVENGVCYLEDSEVLSEQKGVVRVNCIESLDRTNIVTTILSEFVLELQKVNCQKHTLRHAWRSMGNSLSRYYVGANAKCNDVIIWGRTFRGVLEDACSSCARYYQNNFADGLKKNSVDLVLGNLEEVPEYYNPRHKFIGYFLVLLGGSILAAEYSRSFDHYFLVFIGCFVVFLKVLGLFSYFFLDTPTLLK